LKRLLVKEHARVAREQQAQLDTAVNITLNMDGWSSKGMESWYGVTGITADRRVHVLGVHDLSDISHTAAALDGEPTVAAAHVRIAASALRCCVHCGSLSILRFTLMLH
jgi:hypothetical protein